MHPRVPLPLVGRPKGRRLIARVSVRLRREGGSLSITIPRYIVRHWNLEPGARLVLRSTDEGVLLYPRYFLPYTNAAWLEAAAAEADDPEFDDGEADQAEPAPETLTTEDAPLATPP